MKQSLGNFCIVGCLLFSLTSQCPAQNADFLAVEPNISFGGNVKHGLDYFFQMANESRLTEGNAGGESYSNGVQHIETTAGLAHSFSTKLNGAASFTYRLNTPFDGQVGTELRPSQQMTYATSMGKYRFRHRLRADERFRRGSNDDDYRFDLRLTYRLALDFPIEGDRLDNREFYLNANAEFLYTPTQTDALFYREWNSYAGLGFKFNDQYTLECGGVLKTARISRDLGRANNWLVRVVWVVAI